MLRFNNDKKKRVGLAGILLFAAACGSKEFPDGTNYPGSYHLMQATQPTPVTVSLQNPRCEVNEYLRTVEPYDANPDMAEPRYGQIVKAIVQSKNASPHAVWGDDCDRDGTYESGGILYGEEYNGEELCRWGPGADDGALWFTRPVCRADQIANATKWLNTAGKEPANICEAGLYNPAKK
jgi:hypothetical protein